MSQVDKEKEIQSQSWPDLPLDILNIIMNKLFYADQLRFRAVCKNWRSIYGDKYADKLSWVMVYQCCKNYIVCELYDPSHLQKYTIKHSISKKERGIFEGVVEVCASKYGWVLFSKTQERSTSLFFYSPFHREIMELPKLCIKGFKAATFSTSPDCLDCVICALNIDKKNLYVSTCSPRDKTWRTHRFDCFGGKVEGKDMVFVDGTFYWIFSQGDLGSFNIALQDFNMYSGPVLPKYAISSHLVESDGHILIAHHIQYDSIKQEFRYQWHIIRFDQLQKSWSEVENLGNLLLFMGSTLLSVPAEGKASKLANTIHLDGTECRSFYHKEADDKEADDKEADDCRCPQIYDCFDNNRQRKIWIQPPQSKA